MLQAFHNCQTRSKHQTLDNKDPIKLVEIQTMFMLLNWGVKFNQQFLKSNKLNSFLRLPMSNEGLIIP